MAQLQQMQQDLQNELIKTNQLLHLIGIEIQQIMQFTNAGGEFETNIKKNATLMSTLAHFQHIDLENLPLVTRNRDRNQNNNMETETNVSEDNN